MQPFQFFFFCKEGYISRQVAVMKSVVLSRSINVQRTRKKKKNQCIKQLGTQCSWCRPFELSGMVYSFGECVLQFQGPCYMGTSCCCRDWMIFTYDSRACCESLFSVWKPFHKKLFLATMVWFKLFKVNISGTENRLHWINGSPHNMLSLHQKNGTPPAKSITQGTKLSSVITNFQGTEKKCICELDVAVRILGPVTWDRQPNHFATEIPKHHKK
jgi:hypothetical protein